MIIELALGGFCVRTPLQDAFFAMMREIAGPAR